MAVTKILIEGYVIPDNQFALICVLCMYAKR